MCARVLASAAALLALFATREAAAQSTPARTHALTYRLELDLPLTLGSAGAAFALNQASGKLTPTCRWCADNPLDAAVRGWLKADDTEPARFASDVFLVSTPVVMGGLGVIAANQEGHGENVPLDLLVVAEATSVALLGNVIAKVAFARERPRVHAMTPLQRANDREIADRNVSFFSGHTAFTFALATSMGTVAELRGYRAAPAIWGVGLPLAATTGLLRIVADRHYATDVLTGMLVGVGAGVAFPLLLHGRRDGTGTTGASLESARVPISGGASMTQVFSLALPSPL
jgi:membrane-associated phospholipid phosphatase